MSENPQNAQQVSEYTVHFKFRPTKIQLEQNKWDSIKITNVAKQRLHSRFYRQHNGHVVHGVDICIVV